MTQRDQPSAIDGGADDPRLLTRTLGILLCCGGLAVIFAVAFAGAAAGGGFGLPAVGLVAVATGAGALAFARNARPWMAHLLFATGSGLICLGSYFGGGASGLYSVLLVWMAIVAASFFSARAVAAHLVGILIGTGAMLALVDAASGPAPLARWVFGGFLMTIAAVVMSRIAAGRRATESRLRAEIEERERLQKELEHLAGHDPLTGVANRRRLDHVLRRELERAQREGIPLSLATLDLDGLKEHNDTHGHASGDRLLRQVASTWAAGLGQGDLIARTGGDEFVVLFPGCELEQAEHLLDRLRAEVADACTCSVGVACWDGSESREELQVRADLEMYRAKARSRLLGESYSAATRVCQTGSSGRS